MIRTRALSKDEFLTCFAPPMANVTGESPAAGKIDGYLGALDPVSLGIGPLGDVGQIYRDAEARYDQVLIATEREDVFLVIVVKIDGGTVYGHRVLDLNAEYGGD